MHEAPPAGQTRLLIVDDHALLREGLTALLWIDGGVEAAAVAPEEAVRTAQGFGPQVVLLDLTLPGWDAWQLAGELRRRQPAIRVLCLDERFEPAHFQAALELGCAGYCTKALSFDELLSAVRRVAAGQTCFGPSAAAIAPPHSGGLVERRSV